MDPEKPSLREAEELAASRNIRATALRLINQYGFDAVGVDEIAAEAGVSRTTFFNYFAGKEAVIFDPDPGEPQRWRGLFAAHGGHEPLWPALGDRPGPARPAAAGGPAL